MKKALYILLSLALLLGLLGASAEPLTRAFNPDLDRMMEDFTGENPAVLPAYLHVGIDNNSQTPDDAIYKAASPSLEGQSSFEHLTLVLRGDVALENLVLGFRMNDTTKVQPVEFTELLDPDNEPLPELSGDWQDYAINLLALDAQYEDGTVVKPGTIAGFHLMAKEGTAGTLDILQIRLDDTVLDDFSREDVNRAPKGLYWSGSQAGVIVPRHLALTDSEYTITYQEPTSNNLDGAYQNLVVTARGGGSLMVNGAALDGLSGDYQSLVLPLETKEIDTVTLAAQGSVDVKNVFFTNLDEVQAEVESAYPLLDPNDIRFFDDYNYTQEAIPSEWISEEPTAVAAGMNYIVSYHNAALLKVDGALVFDATALEENDYINYKASTTRNSAGDYAYVVLKARLGEGAALGGLRMSAASDDVYGEVIYANNWLSGAGLPLPAPEDESYPYTDEEGWRYLIIDLEKTFGITDVNGFDIYYSGTGKLEIDSIFFANRLVEPIVETETKVELFTGSVEGWWWTDLYNTVVENGEATLTFTGDWAKFRGANPTNNKDLGLPILAIEMKGLEGTTLETLRLRGNEDSEEYVFFNQGKLVDPNGQPLPKLTAEYKTFYIDLAASGLNPNTEGIEIAFGGWADGSVSIRRMYYTGRVHTPAPNREITLFEGSVEGWWWTDLYNTTVENNAATLRFMDDWAKFRGANPTNNKDLGLPYLRLVMNSPDGATLETLRLRGNEDSEEFVFFNQGKLVGILGAALPELAPEDREFIIDLNASGLNPNTEGIEIAFGGWQNGTVNITSIGYFDTLPAAADILAALP